MKAWRTRGAAAFMGGVAAVFLAAGTVRAQDDAREQEDPWSGEFAVGAGLSQGNTEEADANIAFTATRLTDENEVTLKANADYASSDSETTVQRYFASGRYSYTFGEEARWYNFYQADFDRDRFANIDWRVTPSTGVGYWFSRTDDLKLRSEAGLGWERTEFRDGTASRSDAVLVGSAMMDKKLSETASLKQDISVWPSLGDVGEFRLRSETALTSKVTDAVSLRVSLIDEYLSNPAQDKESNDLRLTAAAVYTF